MCAWSMVDLRRLDWSREQQVPHVCMQKRVMACSLQWLQQEIPCSSARICVSRDVYPHCWRTPTGQQGVAWQTGVCGSTALHQLHQLVQLAVAIAKPHKRSQHTAVTGHPSTLTCPEATDATCPAPSDPDWAMGRCCKLLLLDSVVSSL